MRPTIRDVARRAGVSIATVSRVMHEHEHVSPATRDRVAAASPSSSSPPAASAAPLAERRHAANAIVFPDLSGPYYAEVVLGYESVAADLGPLRADPVHARPRRGPGDGRGDGRPLRRHGRDGPHRPRRAAREAARPRHAAGAARPSRARGHRLGQGREHRLGRGCSPSHLLDAGRPLPGARRRRGPVPGPRRALGRVERVAARARRRVRRPPLRRRLRRGVRSRRVGRDALRRRRAGCPTPSSAPTTSSPSACCSVPGRGRRRCSRPGPRHRLGRHHGRPLRRPHHRPPADARSWARPRPGCSTRSSPAAAPTRAMSSSPRSWSSGPPPSPDPHPSDISERLNDEKNHQQTGQRAHRARASPRAWR